MRGWREVQVAFGIRTNITPVIREIKGKKLIFWFRNGNGEIADIVTALKSKGAKVSVVWDDKEGLTGIVLNA